MKPLTVRDFFKQFPDDETCLNHIFESRFGQGYECPKCEKATKWHRIKAERAYSCQYCGHHLHPTVGTPFEKTRTPLQLWFYAIYLFTTTRHGVSAKELQRQLGVTYKTAWRMGHEIREHMADVDGDTPLSGHVEVDETYIGGKERGVMGRPTQKTSKKTAVIGMIQRDGEVITKVIPDVKSKTLIPHIENNIEKGSTVSTDELQSYRVLKSKGYQHGKVHHARDQWVNGEHHTNSIESYWSQLKRSVRSTHIHVSRKHLQKYLNEFEYRFNARENPASMFPELVSSYPEQENQ
jgi:transposase-like protein